MNILITGCAGFIGFSTAKALLHDGHSVVGVDDMNTDYSIPLKYRRIGELRERAKELGRSFTFFNYSINNKNRLEHAFEKSEPFDFVFHFASKAGVRHSLSFPEDYVQTNVLGTLNVLETCKKYGARKLIFSSTSSVYPDTGRQFSEEDKVDNVLSPYSASKLAAEGLISSYVNNFGFSAIIFRYFTVYGPWGRPDMAPMKFLKRIDNGDEIEIYGKGQQERDFTYITDIVDANIKGMDLLMNREPGTNFLERINLGNDHPEQVNALIHCLSLHLGKEAKRVFLERRKEEMFRTHANISKAYHLLLWTPETSLYDGVCQMVKWHTSVGKSLY